MNWKLNGGYQNKDSLIPDAEAKTHASSGSSASELLYAFHDVSSLLIIKKTSKRDSLRA